MGPSGHLRRTGFSLATKAAVAILLVPCVIFLWMFCDPYPAYSRPVSLFFPSIHENSPSPQRTSNGSSAPMEERTRAPFLYTAALDLGTETPNVDPIDVPEGRFVSYRVEDRTERTPEQRRTRRKGAAFCILGDCSRFTGNMLPSLIQPREFIDRLGPDDLISFMTVGNGLEKLLDWATKSEASGMAPTSYQSASMVYQPFGSTEPLTELFADPRCRDLDRIAIIIGDLVPAPTEGRHVLACAEALANSGVRVFVALLESESIDPRVNEVCQASGGAVIMTEDISQVTATMRQIQEMTGGGSVTKHKLFVTFESDRAYREGETISIDVGGTRRSFTIVSTP